MTDPSSRKEAFKKCQNATFSIDGYNFAIGSKSQNCLWNAIIGGLTSNLKERPKRTIINDPRPPEEILADELLPVDNPEALVKASFRFD
ncbi:dual specificity calcium/calmodulin-dependent 3',5'-cyclic nucleotide phosphodiesterase 1C-like [Ammospiza nelsoni]|uniref:dual specificity calcium/calmodulin-dependent 3',5'-cyclic nucleotide phosphodiesterase 1C-like n=1 Tax=Ammospiza nelsoni TaxID=2857394 RepID=UPI002869BF91|nr:dual specificity calcium/calmodulin-dependent 3',5'-cyclic nucleotide phosphodiesterase 1C-like [Ammospiza nelsoni]